MPLKALAEQLGISIVLVHHLRKAADSDPFNMISGSTGLNGCVDGLFVLLKSKRSAGQAVLHCTGRDIEDQELSLARQGARWVLTGEREDKPPDIFVFAVHDLMVEQRTFRGSATELRAELASRFRLTLPSNMVSKKLMQNWQELSACGVRFEVKRSHGRRWLELSYDRSGDSSDSRALVPETCCPAGTADEFVVIDSKQVPVARTSLEDILHRSGARLRQMLNQNGTLLPEHKLAT